MIILIILLYFCIYSILPIGAIGLSSCFAVPANIHARDKYFNPTFLTVRTARLWTASKSQCYSSKVEVAKEGSQAGVNIITPSS